MASKAYLQISVLTSTLLFPWVLTHAVASATSGLAQQTQVRVVVKAPVSTPAQSLLYLTGSSPELCQWRPNCLKMKLIGQLTYSVDFTLSNPSNPVEFKVTRGDWKSEAADAFNKPLANTVIQAAQNETVIKVTNWTDQPPLKPTGHLNTYTNFFSPQLSNTRKIWVWTPPNYAASQGARYPVIYMHDGQNLFDPLQSNTGIDWGVDETMTKQIKQGTIRPAIIVAIEANAQRMLEYDYSIEAGQRYAAFLTDTVKPWVDGHFKTLPGRADTLVAGSSMGALMSVALVWHRPDLFSSAAALSLPVAIKNGAIYRIIDGSAPPQSIKIYMDHGTAGLDATYAPFSKAFYDHLRSLGFTRENLNYQVFPYAEHTEMDWGRRFSIPLQLMLPSNNHAHR